MNKVQKEIHVEHEIRELSNCGETLPGLEVVTPLAIVVALYRFTDESIAALEKRIREKLYYNEDDMITLKIPNSEYDFILITESAIERSLHTTDSDSGGEHLESLLCEFEIQMERSAGQLSPNEELSLDNIACCNILYQDEIFTVYKNQDIMSTENIVYTVEENSTADIHLTIKPKNICILFHMLWDDVESESDASPSIID